MVMVILFIDKIRRLSSNHNSNQVWQWHYLESIKMKLLFNTTTLSTNANENIVKIM